MSPGMAAAAATSGRITDVRHNFDFLGDDEFNPVNRIDIKSKVFTETRFPNPGPIISPLAPYLADSSSEDSSGTAPGLPKFNVLKGIVAPLDIQNIDTDMIIPKEFLKTIKRSGLGFAAFAELRYENADAVATIGEEVAINRDDFILNNPAYSNTKILIAGDNFGCGSSREHAPWSINDMGIRCIISTSFADIFYSNCFNNGMLPLKLERSEVEVLLADASIEGTEITIDLPNQKVIRPNGEEFYFEIDDFKKECLVNGLDKIGLTLEKEEVITSFETERSRNFPWLDGASMMVPDSVPMYPDSKYWELNAMQMA